MLGEVESEGSEIDDSLVDSELSDESSTFYFLDFFLCFLFSLFCSVESSPSFEQSGVISDYS